MHIFLSSGYPRKINITLLKTVRKLNRFYLPLANVTRHRVVTERRPKVREGAEIISLSHGEPRRINEIMLGTSDASMEGEKERNGGELYAASI